MGGCSVFALMDVSTDNFAFIVDEKERLGTLLSTAVWISKIFVLFQPVTEKVNPAFAWSCYSSDACPDWCTDQGGECFVGHYGGGLACTCIAYQTPLHKILALTALSPLFATATRLWSIFTLRRSLLFRLQMPESSDHWSAHHGAGSTCLNDYNGVLGGVSGCLQACEQPQRHRPPAFVGFGNERRAAAGIYRFGP